MPIGDPKKVKIVDGKRTDRPVPDKINIKEVTEEKQSIDDGVKADIGKPEIPEEFHPVKPDPDESIKLAKQEQEDDLQALQDLVSTNQKRKEDREEKRSKIDMNKFEINTNKSGDSNKTYITMNGSALTVSSFSLNSDVNKPTTLTLTFPISEGCNELSLKSNDDEDIDQIITATSQEEKDA